MSEQTSGTLSHSVLNEEMAWEAFCILDLETERHLSFPLKKRCLILKVTDMETALVKHNFISLLAHNTEWRCSGKRASFWEPLLPRSSSAGPSQEVSLGGKKQTADHKSPVCSEELEVARAAEGQFSWLDRPTEHMNSQHLRLHAWNPRKIKTVKIPTWIWRGAHKTLRAPTEGQLTANGCCETDASVFLR